MTRRNNDRTPKPPTPNPSAEAFLILTEMVETLSAQLEELRMGQQRTLKALADNHQVLSHRMTVLREQVSALIKASHTDLLEHIIHLDGSIQDQYDRLNNLERDFDSVFDDPSAPDPDDGSSMS